MTELPVHYDIYGRRYNFAHESIKCRADQGETEVFEVQYNDMYYTTRVQFPVLILAHSLKDAENTSFGLRLL